MYNEHKSEWQSILEEAIQFCNATKGLFTGPHGTQLHLVCIIIATCMCVFPMLILLFIPKLHENIVPVAM